MRAVVKEIQVCGGRLYDNLYRACQDYVECVDMGIDREKLNFSILLENGERKHITIRQWGDEVIAYGDFEGLPDFFEFAKEAVNE